MLLIFFFSQKHRSAVSLGRKRAVPALQAAVETSPATAREKKIGRGTLRARPIGLRPWRPIYISHIIY